MSRLLFRPCLVLLAGLALATGCRTATEGEPAGSKSERTEEKELAQRAEAQAHFAAGVISELNENAPAAYDEFYLAAKSNPRDLELLLEVSNRLIEGRQFAKALEVLTWLTVLPNPPDIVYVRLGFVYAQLGQNKKSIEANRVAVAKMPRFLPVRQNLYFNYLQTRQPAAALKVLDDAATEPGTGAEFLINLAELYINYGRQFPEQRAQVNGKALESLNRAGKLAPLDVSLQLKLADGLSLLGDSDGAVKLYLKLINHGDPSAPLRDILRAKLVDLYLRNHDHAHATEQLNAILRDNPGSASAYYFLGGIAFDEKRWTEAIENYQRAILFNAGFEQAQYDLASAQIAAGRGADAVKTMEAARKQFPARFANEYLLGVAYHEQKLYAEALMHLTAAEAIARAGETNHLSTALYFQLGATSERAGQRAEAEKYFEKAIALSPDNAEALNYLGYMWAEKGEKLERAKELIERALKAEPNSAAFLDSLGWVYFQMGKPREAVDYLLKSIAAAPDEPDATMYDHLGDAYAALKDMDKAREAWARSLSLEASDAVKRKLDAAQTR
jgi:tetratricopeptide (TPR) repeat protein